MIVEQTFRNPFQIQISFHKVIEALEEIAASNVDYRALYAKGLLAEVNKVPELRSGIISKETVDTNEELIRHLLADLFPTALTNNEIKAVTIPFNTVVFNKTQRFERILSEAGTDFDIRIRDMDEHHFYVLSCCMILKFFYGYNLDFALPVFYDIPTADGAHRHYRILYNGDFLEIFPTRQSIPITPEDVDVLMDNFDNLDMWLEKFPPQTWQLSGFGIMTLYDTTVESAVSLLKENLLLNRKKHEGDGSMEQTFRSILNVPDLKIGFTEFISDGNRMRQANFAQKVPSYLMSCKDSLSCGDVLNGKSFNTLIDSQKYYAISDVRAYGEKHPEEKALTDHLLSQGIESCVFAPIVKNERLLGIVELVSFKAKQLNSINANKLDYVLPFISDTLDRMYSERQNKIDAMIQKEYTAIHPSVYWKFREEADLHAIPGNEDLPFREIIFKDVYPLYGQIDIKGSSEARNEAMAKDLTVQIDIILELLSELLRFHPLPLVEQQQYELEKMRALLQDKVRADSELNIQNFIQREIHPLLQHFESDRKLKKRIDEYRSQLDPSVNMVYRVRKDFDQALSLVNKKMAALLDKNEESAQEFFPHYYERFKTDGVEHTLYIGASIAPQLPYNPIYLGNLRLWQLQAMCDLEVEYARLRSGLPYEFDVTSLILLFSSPIAIRFRMDEKRFDVDGTYNARYEVVKKRIDKATIKGTEERITQPGKIVIVYSQDQEEIEYRRYIKLLQHKGRLGTGVEVFDVQDLQGVTGLRALRVEVLYSDDKSDVQYTYNDLVRELGMD
ncbi:GAF domain-containing protein [Flavobacterium silvaticum]|uniref:Metallophosphoesterase family protein n=1 Tax=Flavobacterium silvaticum TaxID=1852020 RepID=A0A972FZD8_9FLAO|nr:GAF domain-containing protein [Flavobacterium silvaticum]NMH27591.1 metallophosphoesterase family protein [Flavobacterium silvaticum]